MVKKFASTALQQRRAYPALWGLRTANLSAGAKSPTSCLVDRRRRGPLSRHQGQYGAHYVSRGDMPPLDRRMEQRVNLGGRKRSSGGMRSIPEKESGRDHGSRHLSQRQRERMGFRG